jgi:N6-L-threonylcarbamoyladenine synthase
MYILGIESSCDDSAVAIINDKGEILINLLSSQINDHIPYGGVVPELAARKHLDNLPTLLELAFAKLSLKTSDIDLICATGGPGLIGGVVIGTTIAKTLAHCLHKPFIAVNHLLGHALCARLTDKVTYPFLLLLASGGHSQFIDVKSTNNTKVIGKTLDDAFGEAFDKVAKMLTLPYPGGPNIEKAAKLGNPNKYKLPLPLRKTNDCNFSLSGLKTSVRTLIAKKSSIDEEFIHDVAASFQKTIADHICDKLVKSFTIYNRDTIDSSIAKKLVFSGGVAANEYLRERITQTANQYSFELFVPPPNLCTDNAVMIAWAGYEQYLENGPSSLTFEPRSKWPL